MAYINLIALSHTPKSLNHQQLNDDLAESCRRLRLKELYFEPINPAPEHPDFYKKRGCVPPSGRVTALGALCDTLRTFRHIPDMRILLF